jgi:hypothetical protein
MIEAMKQALEALEDVGVLTDREWQAVHKNKANELRQAIREHAMYEVQRLGQEIEQEPVTWRNAAIRVGEDLCSVGPFGYYDMTANQWLDWALSVVTVHSAPRLEQNFCPRCGKRTNDIHTCTPPQRTWVGLTKDEVDSWNLPDHPTVFEFAQFIEARLKEKNT